MFETTSRDTSARILSGIKDGTALLRDNSVENQGKEVLSDNHGNDSKESNEISQVGNSFEVEG